MKNKLDPTNQHLPFDSDIVIMNRTKLKVHFTKVVKKNHDFGYCYHKKWKKGNLKP